MEGQGVVLWAQCVWYLLPMGMGNLAPFFARGHLQRLAVPLDSLVRRPGLFGTHKTVRGIVAALVVGTLAFLVQKVLSVYPPINQLDLFSYWEMTWWFGVLAGLGAILGDLARSWLKRRAGIRPGERFFPFDQVDYVLGGMLFTVTFYQPSAGVFLVTVTLGILLHVIFNFIGHALGWKEKAL